MDDVKKTYVWQDAVSLAAQVMKVCEQFTQSDGNVLVGHLRQSAIDVPASIAGDLLAHREANMEPLTKLAVELELVSKVYPAIDIEQTQSQLQKIIDRIKSGQFNEMVPEPVAESPEQPEGQVEGSETQSEGESALDENKPEPKIITPTEG